MALKQTLRWYGPSDPVSLSDIAQAGASGVVTALHQSPVGEVWSVEDIKERKSLVESASLSWEVVESVNIHESIKMGLSTRDQYISNYISTLQNLARCGIRIVCYNFMPVLDWTRTELSHRLDDGSAALSFDNSALAAFDIYILKREGAAQDYSEKTVQKAGILFEKLNSEERYALQNNILAGLPGTKEIISISSFRDYLNKYKNIDRGQLRENLKYFLEHVIPVAEEVGVKLAIHPDDPPYPIFGLPRIISTEQDFEYLLSCEESESNGITFCTGSLAPRPENDLAGMMRKFGHRIHFFHLRNILRKESGSFYESNHLHGDVNMVEVMREAILEMKRRKESGRKDVEIPMRPDHGHQMLDDLGKAIVNPGYSAIGRLRGLAELRGLELGIQSS